MLSLFFPHNLLNSYYKFLKYIYIYIYIYIYSLFKNKNKNKNTKIIKFGLKMNLPLTIQQNQNKLLSI